MVQQGRTLVLCSSKFVMLYETKKKKQYNFYNKTSFTIAYLNLFNSVIQCTLQFMLCVWLLSFVMKSI